MGWLVRIALCVLGWVLGILSAFVGILFVSLPGTCEEPGHSCGGWWVPAGVLLLLLAIALIFAGSYVGLRRDH
jgi:hypothetical protein